MSQKYDESFKSQSAFERATVAKSFKFGASKDSEVLDIQYSIAPLANLARDLDLNVRRYALESLTAITHTLPHAAKNNA
jgi:hypothetical protein